jgi:hypothetical protein
VIGDREDRLLATVCLDRRLLFVPDLVRSRRDARAPLVALTLPDGPVPSAETVALPDVFVFA